MKTIFPPTETAGKLCGIQKYRPEQKYRYSSFALQTLCEDGMLLFNTLTGELCLIDKTEKSEQQKLMVEKWLLVPEPFDEKKMVQDYRRIARLLNPARLITNYSILTTTDCNARCYYCYENRCKKATMTETTAHETAKHIIRVCGGEKVSIHWFGGEPLLNRQAIEIIVRDLRAQGIAFISKMTSNGFFLDKETAHTAVNEWHLKNVQITLDGTHDVYNRTKAYINESGDPYVRVLDNIEASLDAGVRVSLRLNMSEKNHADLLQLVKQLGARFAEQENLIVYTALLGGTLDSFSTPEKESEYLSILTKAIYENKLQGKRKFERAARVFGCMADDGRSEVIMPDGNIVMCDVFDETEVVGHITTDKRNRQITKLWNETKDFEQCADCVMYPRCFNLKKCPMSKEYCPAGYREREILTLQDCILTAYHSYKSEQREAST